MRGGEGMTGKRVLGSLLWALLILVIALPRPAQAGRLVRVGIYQNEPLVFRDADGHASGFYIDILEDVAAEEGWELQFVDCSFPDCLALLEEGRLDLMTAIAYAPERAERFSFNQETVLANWGQVYTRDNHLQSLLDLQGKTVAGVREDIYYTGLRTMLQSLDVFCSFLVLDDYAPVLQAVEAGRADAGVVARLYGLGHASDYDIVRSPILCCPVSLRFAAPKGQGEALLETLDRHLRAMKAEPNSRYYQALERWFASAIEQPPLLERVPPWLMRALLAIAVLAALGTGGSLLFRAQLRARTAELRESERRYRGLFDHLPVGVFRSTPEGRLLAANPALVSLLGYPDRETLLQTPIEALFADPATCQEVLQALGQSGEEQGLTFQLRRYDGTRIWVREHARAVVDERGQVIRYEGTLEDVTPQVRLQKTLEVQASQQAALANLSLQGLSQQDFVAFLSEAARLITQTLKAAHCHILRYEEREGVLREIVGVGSTVDEPRVLPFDDPTATWFTYTMQHGLVAVEDFRTEDRFRVPSLVAEHGIHSGICVVIGEPARPWGLLGVCDVVPRAWASQAQSFVQVAASVIGQAAARHQHARNLETLREIGLEIASHLDLDSLLPLILERAVTLMRGERGTLYLYRPERDVLELAVASDPDTQRLIGLTLPRGKGLVGRVWARHEPLVIEDYQRWPGRLPDFAGQPIRAVMGIPIHWGDTFLGVFSLADNRPGTFTAVELELARLFANQVAVALHNARLFAQLAHDREQLAFLHYFSQRLASSLDPRTVARQALADLCGGVGARAGLLFTSPTGDPHRLHLEASVGHDPAAVAALRRELDAQPSEGSLTVWVAAQRRTAIVLDPAQDPRWRPYAGLDEWARSALCVPLLSQEQTVGVLLLTSDRPGAFNEEYRELVESAAAMMATSLANARLYQEARRRALAEETLHQAALALSTVHHTDEAIERILAELERVVPYDSASVQRLEGHLLRIVGGRGFPNLEELLGLSFDITRTDNPNRQVVLTQRPLIVDDAPQHYPEFRRKPHTEANIRAWLGVPMIVGDRLIGIITLDKHEPGFYTEEHARLAEAFAAQAAVALENARLYQAEREQRELAEALAQAAAIVSSTLDLDQVLDLILDQARRVVPGDTFNIMLMEGEQARIVRAWGYEKFLSEPVPVGEDAEPMELFPTLREMMRRGRATCIPDTANDPRWVPVPGRTWQRAYVGAPICIHGKTVGFLNVNGQRVGQFGPQDAHRLQAFADYVATALENARLYRELERYAEELEARVAARTAELEAERARLQAIVDNTGDGIVVTDAQGTILRTNRVAARWLDHDLNPEDAAALRQAIAECVQHHADGRSSTMLELSGLDLELVAASIAAPDGQGDGDAVVAIHDITHLRALDRMKTRFIANVSHELRTPATGVLLYAHLLRTAPSEKAPGYLEALEKEARHQAQLIESILELSRIDAGRLDLTLQHLALNNVVAEAVAAQQETATQAGVRLDFVPCEPSPRVKADVQRLRQVIDNLLVNALHYTPAGGQVTVRTGRAQDRGHDWATVSVQDTGIGIPEHELPHIFERFYRGEAPQRQQISGTGLGLSIAGELVEMHGGRITVESREGEGSTFTVWLPLESPEPL